MMGKDLAGPLILLGGGYLIAQKLIGNQDEKKTGKTVDDAIKEEEQQGETPSYSAVEFQNFADQVHEGFRYSMVADDYDGVERVLKKMKKRLDVLKLQDAFGFRDEAFFGVPLAQKSLAQFVQKDFSDSRIRRVNKYYQDNGVQYQF